VLNRCVYHLKLKEVTKASGKQGETPQPMITLIPKIKPVTMLHTFISKILGSVIKPAEKKHKESRLEEKAPAR